MSEQYLITIKKVKQDDANSTERYNAKNISSKRLVIEGSYPKKQLINIMLNEAEKLGSIEKITIINSETDYQRFFSNTIEFFSWLKSIPINKMCDIKFSFSDFFADKKIGAAFITFFIERYNNTINKIGPKLLTLEVRDFFNGEFILSKNYSDFKNLENYVSSLIDPSHKKFSPSNPCVNRDCSFIVNDCDITDYFYEKNNFKLNHYKSNGSQILEYTELYFLNETKIQHVLAIDTNNVPTLIYSCVRDELGNTTRERGIFEGAKWEKTFDNTAAKSKFPQYDGLVVDLYNCYTKRDIDTFTKLLTKYHGEYPTVSFVTIEMTHHYGVYSFYEYKYKLMHGIMQTRTNEFNTLIPPHHKWNYDDFDVIL